MKRKEPRTPEEWQEAVNLAAAWRKIHDCKLYGLIDGGPGINWQRCDYIRTEGARLGYLPNVNVTDFAVGLIGALNEEAKEKKLK